MTNINNVFGIGMTAVEAVTKIVEINPQVSTLSFFIYRPTYNLKEAKRKERPLLSDLIRHNPAKENLEIHRDYITPENISSYFIPLKKGYVLGVLSRVRVDQGYLHIPMLDFEKIQGENTLFRIEHFLQEIGQEGVILFSGRSYHFYGINLMTEEEQLDFLGDCLLSELADSRYIAHRLKDQFSVLRLSACPLRPKIPEVIGIVS